MDLSGGACVSCRHLRQKQGEYGRCLRYPPVLVAATTIPVEVDKWLYPRVHIHDTCGEWAKDKK